MRKPDQDPSPELPPVPEDGSLWRIIERLTDNDAGRLIPHEEVERWVQELSNIPELSPEAIDIIRDANRHLEDDYKPTYTLIPGL